MFFKWNIIFLIVQLYSQLEIVVNGKSIDLEDLLAEQKRQNELISRLPPKSSHLQRVSFRQEDPYYRRGKKLFFMPDDYDKRRLPPRVKEGEVNKIHVSIDIYGIPLLDEKLEEIMLELKISHMWADLRLNTSEMKRPLELEPTSISDFWTPDSYFHHVKASNEVKIMTPVASLRVRPDKIIQYTKIILVTLGCPMSFYNYPMDNQICRLELQSFGYDMNLINYTWMRPPQMKKDIIIDNHDVEIADYTFEYSPEGIRFSGLGIRIELKRHLGFHITQSYIPSIIFVAIAWMSFHVPSDVVPGRMVLSVTTLLTLISMFNSVRSLTPQVSYMKALDLWVFCVCLVFVFSSLAEYGFVLYLTSRSGWQKKVDADIRTISGSDRLVNPANFLRLISGGMIQRTQKNYSTANMNGVVSKVMPKTKERVAYSIEYIIKIIYPLAFFGFNYTYWTYYLSRYSNKLDPS
ncbi:GLRA2 [Lepeophtheirus salmonis]|uniref:GLRA2 n=1 Tax=Lepeophtheirus salmonis TaxID=72036 RepID=A0A7R8DAZ3_LEPSM|nr:GLRA2 [Lepeophtheirus salmonis]CAF3030043.1 GLRA2 [Lepeophtheirus salmonis]